MAFRHESIHRLYISTISSIRLHHLYQFSINISIILHYKTGIERPRSARRAPRRDHGGLARPTQHSIFFLHLETQFPIIIPNLHRLHISTISSIRLAYTIKLASNAREALGETIIISISRNL